MVRPVVAVLRTLRWRWVVAVAMCVGACGCSGASAPSAPSSPASPISGAPTPASSTPRPQSRIEQQCTTAVPAAVRVTETKVRSPGGVSLRVVTLGSGPHGVVLLHQTDGTLCGWLPYGGYLAHRGFHVGLVDLRCHGDSSCPRSAAAVPDVVADVATLSNLLRTKGARTIGVVGASYGGAVAIGACEAVRADGCAALSPALLDEDLGGGLTAAKAVTGLSTPLLLAVAPDDGSSPLDADRALAEHAPTGTVDLEVLPAGAGHGWETVEDPTTAGRWSSFSTSLVRFLSTRR